MRNCLVSLSFCAIVFFILLSFSSLLPFVILSFIVRSSPLRVCVCFCFGHYRLRSLFHVTKLHCFGSLVKISVSFNRWLECVAAAMNSSMNLKAQHKSNLERNSMFGFRSQYVRMLQCCLNVLHSEFGVLKV